MFLAQQDYAAGDHLTIADLSLLASASNMEVTLIREVYLINVIILHSFFKGLGRKYF